MVLDFVSPENVTECIHLIDEVRLLPEDHKAKVDKLEVDFIRILIYHLELINNREAIFLLKAGEENGPS